MLAFYFGRVQKLGRQGCIIQSTKMELDVGWWLGNRRTDLVNMHRSSQKIVIFVADYLDISCLRKGQIIQKKA